MELLIPECKHPFLVFDEVVNPEKINDVLEEISYLKKFYSEPSETASASDQFGNPIKKNKGIWLTDFYNMSGEVKKNSPIMSGAIRMLEEDVSKSISNYDNIFAHFIPERLRLHTLLSLYEDGDCYPPHCDKSIYTAVLWFGEDDKKYTGGEFLFHFADFSEEVEFKNNRMVLFPSFYTHEVKVVNYTDDNAFPRCSVSTFFCGL